MPKMTIPFGNLLPDQAGFKNPGVTRAVNVVPQVGSYGPFKSLVAQSNALATRCLGAVQATDGSGNVYVYAGTASKLYELVGGTFTDESKGGGYSLASDDVWEMAVWNRNSLIIATNYTDAVQSLAIGGGGAAEFADLITGTNKPKAKHLGIIGQFVVLGNTNDATDGIKPTRVWWSAFGNELNFDPDAATQSDYEDLPTGGAVQRIVGGAEYGLVFQKDMVRSMRYVGGGTIFELLPLNYAPGTSIPNSVIAYKGRVFYIAEDGFFAINGTEAVPIGTGQVDRRFWDQFNAANRRYLSASVDPVRKLVCWAFPGENASSNLPNKMMMYKYDEGKWAEADVETEILVKTETQGYTLEGLDTLGINVDDASVFDVSFDSDRWQGGSLRFGAFDQTHKLSFFTGPPLAGSITTGDIQPAEGMRWQLSGVRPIIDGSQVSVSVASRNSLKDTISYGTATAENAEGWCKVRREGRYQRISTSLTSSVTFSHFQGLEIEYDILGER